MDHGQIVHILSSSLNPTTQEVEYAVRAPNDVVYVTPWNTVKDIPALPLPHATKSTATPSICTLSRSSARHSKSTRRRHKRS